MRMNSTKTKIMNITRNNPTQFEIKIGANDIEQVSSFVYLGQLQTEVGKSEKDIIRRFSISRGVFNKMRNVVVQQRYLINHEEKNIKILCVENLVVWS